MIEKDLLTQNETIKISNLSSNDFNEKKEWHFVTCPYCKEIGKHIPIRNRYKGNRLYHTCRACNKQFSIKNYVNAIPIFNCDQNVYENSIFFKILSEIGVSGNCLKRVRNEYSNKTLYKHINYLYNNRCIVYDLLKIDEITSHFKIDFVETIKGINAVFVFFVYKPKSKISEEKLKNLKPSNFKRLGINSKLYINKVKRGFLLEFHKRLPKYSFAMEIAIRKKIEYYIAKVLKSRFHIKSHIPKNLNVTGIVQERVDGWVVGKLHYELGKILGGEVVNKVDIGNFYRLISRVETAKYRVRIHKICIQNICAANKVFNRLSDIVINTDNSINGNYSALAFQRGGYLQFFICNRVLDKQRDGKANWGLIIAGMKEFILKLYNLDFSILEITLVLYCIFSYEVIVEIGLGVLTHERLILEYFDLNKRYRTFGLTYWFDKSNGHLELDISAKTTWLNLFNTIEIFDLLKEVSK